MNEKLLSTINGKQVEVEVILMESPSEVERETQVTPGIEDSELDEMS